MRKAFWLLILATASLAANSVMTTGVTLNAHPQPPTEYEFYWDDGILSSGWIWYTGGNYWAVQFDEVKTGGDDGWVTKVGAVTYPGWPDGSFQGANMHIFDDLGGYPGEDLWGSMLGFNTGGVYEWLDVEPPQPVGPVFYVAFQQVGNYPNADAIGVDAVAGTHDWTGYQGSWAPSTSFGDFMIRCYWDDEPIGVTDTTWGAVKALY
jgi:hypothetical protein